MSSAAEKNLQVLGAGAVCSLLGISRPTLLRWVRLGQFPTPLQLSQRRVGWSATEISLWLAGRQRGVLPVPPGCGTVNDANSNTRAA